MKRKYLHIVFILLWLSEALTAQDAQFSQYYSNSLYLAPSFAGVAQKDRVSINYRKQWPNIPNGFTTMSVSYDRDFEKINSGLGLLYISDYAGSGFLGYKNLGLIYSYDFRATRSFHIRPGVQFLYTERSLDFDKLQLKSELLGVGDDFAEIPFRKVSDVDFSASALAYTNNYWFGISFDHLLKPNQSLYYRESSNKNQALTPVKTSFFGGMKFIIKQELLRPKPTSLTVSYLYRQQSVFKQLDFGVYWHREPLVLGFWFRGIPVIDPGHTTDSFIALVGYKLKYINIGYSYDFTVSKLISSTNGAHEISMSYLFSTKIKKRKRKAVPCPVF